MWPASHIKLLPRARACPDEGRERTYERNYVMIPRDNVTCASFFFSIFFLRLAWNCLNINSVILSNESELIKTGGGGDGGGRESPRIIARWRVICRELQSSSVDIAWNVSRSYCRACSNFKSTDEILPLLSSLPAPPPPRFLSFFSHPSLFPFFSSIYRIYKSNLHFYNLCRGNNLSLSLDGTLGFLFFQDSDL